MVSVLCLKQMLQSLSISVKSEAQLSKYATLLTPMLEYPLDIRGVLIQKTSACCDPYWIAPFIWKGNFEKQFEKLIPKIREKYRLLIESDCNYDARIIPRAAGLAARLGMISLAKSFIDYYLSDGTEDSSFEARAVALLADEKMKVRRLLNSNREWPKGVWNLQDAHAWLIPTFIRRFRKLVNTQAVTIISGGHILAPGNWQWNFERNSVIPSNVIPFQ